MRSYTELISLPDFEARFNYLKIGGVVGQQTFGLNRYLNQAFYRSKEWQRVRRAAIIRDNGCDLGLDDRPIRGAIYVHHIEPISIDSLVYADLSRVLSLENLICCSFITHQAIHYGDVDLLPKELTLRHPGDTCPWR